MAEYSIYDVRLMFPKVTSLQNPPLDEWRLWWEIADEKVRSDGFTSDAQRVLGACYYIAYLATATFANPDGNYTSESKTIGNMSRSVNLAHGTETSNIWLDRYNALIENTARKEIGGSRVHLPPPATGYRDNATQRRVVNWWRHGRL